MRSAMDTPPKISSAYSLQNYDRMFPGMVRLQTLHIDSLPNGSQSVCFQISSTYVKRFREQAPLPEHTSRIMGWDAAFLSFGFSYGIAYLTLTLPKNATKQDEVNIIILAEVFLLLWRRTY